MNKKHKFIGISFLLVGVILITIGIIFNKSEDTLLVFDFKYEKIKDDFDNNGLRLNFLLLNNGDKVIENEKMIINFYNKNKVVHKLEYKIDHLEINQKDEIDYQEMFDKNDITKYEIIYNNKKIKVLDYETWKKKNNIQENDFSKYQVGKSELKLLSNKLEEVSDGVKLSLVIENSGTELIKNDSIEIKFYKEDKEIYSMLSDIAELAPEFSQVIKPTIEIKAEDFDRYEIIYNNKVLNG